MNRREFCLGALAVTAGCGAGEQEMAQEYTIQQSPVRTQHGINTAVRTYAEGLWTPSLGGTATYTRQLGYWTRIGNRIFIDANITVNTIGTGSTSIISGLPFTAFKDPDTSQSFPMVVQVGNAATSIVSVIAIAAGGSTSLQLRSRTIADIDDQANAIFQNGATAFISGVYITKDDG